MKFIISENQFEKLNKSLNELSPKSSGVEDFFDEIKKNKGSVKHLGFNSFKSLEDFVLDGTQKEFEELKKEMKDFLKNKEKSK